ncbi:Hypothetical predicted protein, partial [Paramuricea clavata]
SPARRALPRYLRIDRGTETDSVIYGPSTSNKIERWWRDLHERLEKFFKQQLTVLLQRRQYNPFFSHDRQLLAYVYVPIVQRECTNFVNYWNSHRIRAQDKLEIPTGIPNHMFAFPENYGATNESIDLSDDDIQDVAEVSGVMDEEHIVNFIDPDTKQQCVGLIPNPEKIEAKNAIEAYRFLNCKLFQFIYLSCLEMYCLQTILVHAYSSSKISLVSMVPNNELQYVMWDTLVKLYTLNFIVHVLLINGEAPKLIELTLNSDIIVERFPAQKYTSCDVSFVAIRIHQKNSFTKSYQLPCPKMVARISHDPAALHNLKMEQNL